MAIIILTWFCYTVVVELIFVQIPGLFLHIQKTSSDWEYYAEVSEKASIAMPNGSYWPRAKMLGGCSSMNFMLYVRGNKRDYNSWAESGCDGWSWRDVLAYFKKFERNELFANSDHHSVDGELKIGNFSRSKLTDMFVEAAAELGFAKLSDINEDKFIGMVELQGTLYNGRRQSTAKAFLSPLRRPNLHIIKHAHVVRVILKKLSATEVQFNLQSSRLLKAKAKKEIILSAGAVNTPQIMMLSGLGPRAHLKRYGVQTIVDLPVGRNLQDHIIVAHFIALDPEVRTNAAYKDYMQYLLHQSGAFTGNGGTYITLFLNTESRDTKYPNLQYHYLFFEKGDNYRMPQFFKLMGFHKEYEHSLLETSKTHDIAVVWITLLNPKSTGRIELRNNNPFEKVKIFANYLDHQDDVKLLVKGLKLQREFLNTKPLKNVNASEIRFKLPECDNFPIESDEYLACYVRFFSTTIYHPVGTARMGPRGDHRSVVDPQLRVRGVSGLRVIDASIMPSLVSGNTNAPVIMIGEKGADLIKTDWLSVDSSHLEL